MEALNGYAGIKTTQHTGAEGSDTHTHTSLFWHPSSPIPSCWLTCPAVIKRKGCRTQGILQQAFQWHLAGFISEEEKENFAAAVSFARELLP